MPVRDRWLTRTSQPQSVAKPATWARSAGIRLLVNAGVGLGYDAATDSLATLTINSGTRTVSVLESGLAEGPTPTGGSYGSGYSRTAPIFGTGDITVVHVTGPSPTGYGIVQTSGTSFIQTAYGFDSNSTSLAGRAYFSALSSGVQRNDAYVASGIQSATSVYVWRKRGTSIACWINGQQQTVTTSSSWTTLPDVSAQPAYWGGHSPNGGLSNLAGDGLIAVFASSLSDQLCQQVSTLSGVWSLFEDQRIWVPVAAGGGAQSVAIGQASETDTAQPISALTALTTAIGQASETDSAQVVTAVRTLTQAVGQAAETDTAQSVTASLTGALAIGQATETDAAQPVSSSGATVQAIGQASGTDAAQPMAAALSLTVAIGQPQETDTAQAVSPVVSGSTLIGQASETDTAQPVTVVPGALTVAIGQAVEADSAQAMAVQAVATITAGLALEIDTAQAFTASTGGAVVAIGQAAETDLAQAVAAVASGGTAAAAEVWNYVLSNGLTAEQTAVETHAMLTALTAILGADVAPGINTLQGLRIILAAVSGPTTGIGTDTERYYSPDGATARITATFDALGNRQSVTLDPS